MKERGKCEDLPLCFGVVVEPGELWLPHSKSKSMFLKSFMRLRDSSECNTIRLQTPVIRHVRLIKPEE
jgi:hypothetical protein